MEDLFEEDYDFYAFIDDIKKSEPYLTNCRLII